MDLGWRRGASDDKCECDGAKTKLFTSDLCENRILLRSFSTLQPSLFAYSMLDHDPGRLGKATVRRFAPRRTIVASFGFNEESSVSSVVQLANFLVDRYGENGTAIIVEEGMEIIGKDTLSSDGGLGVTWVGSGTSEKGYLDAHIVATTPGGHSSQPPRHTGIGFLGRLLAAIEDHPPQPTLNSISYPALAPYLCLRNAPEMRERKGLRKVLTQLAKLSNSANSFSRKRKERTLLAKFLKALTPDKTVAFKTTQAVILSPAASKSMRCLRGAPLRSIIESTSSRIG